MRRNVRHCQAGFSLMELLIAVAIAGILAAAAMPAYLEQVIRTRRTEGQGALQALMQQQERHFTQHNRYIAFAPGTADPEASLFRWWSGNSVHRSAYEIEGRACDGESIADCVQLIATPGTSRVDSQFRDEACDQLILTSRGERRATGTAGTSTAAMPSSAAMASRCWR